MANKPNPSIKASKGSSKSAALFRVLGTIILIAVICVGIPATVPRLCGYQVYNIVSGSMEPTIPIGAAVYAKYVDPSTLNVGDILAYTVDGDIIVHRIIENDTENRELHTQGDANEAEDMWAVPYEDVNGRVRVSIIKLGSFLEYATSNVGKRYILLVLFAGVMFTVLGKLLESRNNADKAKGKADAASKPKDKGKDGKASKAVSSEKEEDKPQKSAIAAAAEGAPTLTVKSAILTAEAREEGAEGASSADRGVSDGYDGYPEPDKVITTNDLKDAPKPQSSQQLKFSRAVIKDAPDNRANRRPAPAAKDKKKEDKEEKKDDKNPEKPQKPDKKAEKKAAKLAKQEQKANAKKKPEKAGKKQPKEEEAKTEPAKDMTPEEEEEARRKAQADADYARYKKAIKIIIIVVVALIAILLGILGAIMIIQSRYAKEDAVNNSAQQFTQTASSEPKKETPQQETDTEVWSLKVTEACPLDIDFDSLWEVNEDVVAWLYCEDTVINYPVLQGEDDEYYLHHSYDHSSSSSGSIFIDCNNMSDFSDVNTIIYGHHMKNGSMFASLQNWEEQDFYEAHKYMWLITPDANYQVWLFSGYLTDAYSDSYVGIRNWGDMAEEYIYTAYNGSDFKADVPLEDLLRGDPQTDQRYVMLSTCEYEFTNARYVLHGKLVKE